MRFLKDWWPLIVALLGAIAFSFALDYVLSLGLRWLESADFSLQPLAGVLFLRTL